MKLNTTELGNFLNYFGRLPYSKNEFAKFVLFGSKKRASESEVEFWNN